MTAMVLGLPPMSLVRKVATISRVINKKTNDKNQLSVQSLLKDFPVEATKGFTKFDVSFIPGVPFSHARSLVVGKAVKHR